MTSEPEVVFRLRPLRAISNDRKQHLVSELCQLQMKVSHFRQQILPNGVKNPSKRNLCSDHGGQWQLQQKETLHNCSTATGLLVQSSIQSQYCTDAQSLAAK